MRDFRVFRVLRVALALARVLPRYWRLLAIERFSGRPAEQDAWDAAHRRAAAEIRRLALALRGGFVKVAQIAGARADVLPKPFIEELSQFHDDVPPRPFDVLRTTIESELAAPLDAVFASVDERPLGAASLAQVHRARLRDGSDVVIKVQYPEARRIFPLDLRLARWVAGLIQSMQSVIDLKSLAVEVTRFVEMELDFRREAQSTERLGKILAPLGNVRTPRIHPEYTRDRVIVMEYLEGIQITRTAALRAAGHRLSDVARRVGSLYGGMIFEYGFFHGDPHPGNLLVLADGRIGLLDFGLCKELPPNFARSVARMMVSALIGDGPETLAAARELGFDIGDVAPEKLRSLMLRLFGDSADDGDLLQVLGGTRIRRIPEDFALVLRTMILLNGLSHRLAPGRRLLQGELLKHLAAGAQAGEGSETATARA